MGKDMLYVGFLTMKIDEDNNAKLVAANVKYMIFPHFVDRIEDRLEIGKTCIGPGFDQPAPYLQCLCGTGVVYR